MLSALTRDLSGNREAGTPSYLIPEVVALCFGFLKNNFVFLVLAVRGHHCCVGFSVVAAGGLLSSCASHCSSFS